MALRELGALAVEPRVLRRIIRRHRGLSGLGLEIVHGRCYTLPRAALLELVRPEELRGELGGADVPDQPILVPAGTPEDELPRLVFHARVHQALGARRLSDAVLRERVHRIGQTEFDEIRFVLRQDDLLLPPRDDRETYTEFAALFLELRHFAPGELARTFPTLRDLDAIDALLARDVDARKLLPEAPSAPVSNESSPAVLPRRRTVLVNPELAPDAAQARARGNLAHAAVYAIAAGDPAAARADLERLAEKLGLPDPKSAGATLYPLAHAAAADGARRTPPLRLLYDLQKAAIDLERETLSVNLFAWAATLGRRRLVRPLPAGRNIRNARDLERASAKLAKLRLPEAEGAPIAALLHDATAAAGARARAHLRPVIEEVLDEVKLVPANLPEEVARSKLVAELLDGAAARGQIGLGQLRDSLARSNLKLEGLAGVGELVRGDALLRADRLLGERLEGVYRRGEIYLRFLQKLSSVLFGTAAGRFLTLYAILPVLAAYVLLAGLAHIVGPLASYLFDVDLEIFSYPRFAVLAAYFFGLLHSRAIRRTSLHGVRGLGRGLYVIFIAAPRAFWRLGPVQALIKSPATRLAWRFAILPAIFGALVLVFASRFGIERHTAFIVAVAGFILWNLVANSRLGQELEELTADALVRAGRHLGKRIVPGLVRLILDVFKALLETIDRAIYAVDEALRFRRGDSRVAFVVKAVFGTLWAGVAYVLRIYVNLLIEPTVNPVKHFPIVTVSAKVMVSVYRPLMHGLGDLLRPFLGRVAAPFATTTVLLLPGFWGFLAWELMANWDLYRANRPADLRPLRIGHHGETMGAFLRPGLHSGTIPKTYAKLRRAVWRGKDAGKHKEALHHVAQAIERFTERELAALLDRAPGWTSRVTVAHVDIGSNRVRIELARDGGRAAIFFEDQSSWLVGSLAEPGFTTALPPAESAIFAEALAGFYKLAGVDFVREQIAGQLPAGVPYDIAPTGVVYWTNDWQTETVIPLDREKDDRGLFHRRAIPWESWVKFWEDLTLPSQATTLLSR